MRTLIHTHPPENYDDAADLIDQATAQYAVCTAIHNTLKLSPGAIIFGRDMLLDVPLIADFETLCQRCQALINHNLIVANQKRISFDYQPGQRILKAIYSLSKMEPLFEGPYLII